MTTGDSQFPRIYKRYLTMRPLQSRRLTVTSNASSLEGGWIQQQERWLWPFIETSRWDILLVTWGLRRSEILGSFLPKCECSGRNPGGDSPVLTCSGVPSNPAFLNQEWT